MWRIIVAYLLLFSSLKQIACKMQTPWVGVVFYDERGISEDILCRMLKN